MTEPDLTDLKMESRTKFRLFDNILSQVLAYKKSVWYSKRLLCWERKEEAENVFWMIFPTVFFSPSLILNPLDALTKSVWISGNKMLPTSV